jgi:hypothetical protein
VSPEQDGHQGKQTTARSTLSPIDSSVSKVAKTKSTRPRQKRSISCGALHRTKEASIKPSSHPRSSKRISTLKQLHPIHSSRVSKPGRQASGGSSVLIPPAYSQHAVECLAAGIRVWIRPSPSHHPPADAASAVSILSAALARRAMKPPRRAARPPATAKTAQDRAALDVELFEHGARALAQARESRPKNTNKTYNSKQKEWQVNELGGGRVKGVDRNSAPRRASKTASSYTRIKSSGS